jgi:hypothetical protein
MLLLAYIHIKYTVFLCTDIIGKRLVPIQALEMKLTLFYIYQLSSSRFILSTCEHYYVILIYHHVLN